jgi:hypothetical protein
MTVRHLPTDVGASLRYTTLYNGANYPSTTGRRLGERGVLGGRRQRLTNGKLERLTGGDNPPLKLYLTGSEPTGASIDFELTEGEGTVRYPPQLYGAGRAVPGFL